MLNKQNERKTMTKYKTLIQYVSWNEDVEGSVKKAEVKKTKLENQGYILKHTNAGIFSALLVYENPNYKNKYKKESA